MVTYTLKVVERRQETEDTLTLCFKQPGLRKVKYKAGQYLTLIFRINGRRYIRPYSFSSAPLIDSLLEITVKRIPYGIVSNHIHDQISVNDVIEVMEPMGDFIYAHDDSVTEIYFWGVGSGITPLLSLIKSILYTYPAIKLNLIYGNKNDSTTIFFDSINNLLGNYPLNFRVWHFHTQIVVRNQLLPIIEGRINKKDALRILNGADLANSRHYICGPVGLKESVKECLSSLKVPSEFIFSEDFELIKDPLDFEKIKTQNINLKFGGVEYALEVIKGKSILESALNAGIELPYSCQTGDCSTCKAICTSGEVKMIGFSKERSDLQQMEYLLCCSHPLSDNVHIEI